jgi:UDP:flavonoid glycosyltransferase YjiC (YdhE family)
LTRGDDALLVASPGIIAARLLQEAGKISLVSVILQPWMIPSVQSPPIMMSGLTLPRWAPRLVGGLYYRLIDAIGSHLLGAEFKQLRAELALEPMRGMFRWWFSPDLALGLFPEWFGPPQSDWPPQIRLAGFPVDGLARRGLPANLSAFCQDGKRVIAFTFGTGMMHARELFREAIEACGLLGSRAVLLTRFRSQLPDELPPFVHHCEFASFAELFPLCAAVVHHGGIGTVSNALAAGTPQLILPFAFDQLDNAVRVKKLGAGAWLNPARRNAREIAAVLSRFLSSEARAFSQGFTGRPGLRNGIERAANQIEAFAKARLSGPAKARK